MDLLSNLSISFSESNFRLENNTQRIYIWSQQAKPMTQKTSSAKQYLEITDRKNRVHYVLDNRQNRKFHTEQAAKGQPGDKPKSIKLITGHYVPHDEIRGAQEFEKLSEIDTLFENLSPEDSKLVAATSENEALRSQIEALQKELAAKSDSGTVDEGGEGDGYSKKAKSGGKGKEKPKDNAE
jgi:hypothetical protein